MVQAQANRDALTRWSWRGVVAVILATGVSLAITITLAVAVLSSHQITDAEAQLISGVIGAAVGAVATYLGGHARSDDD